MLPINEEKFKVEHDAKRDTLQTKRHKGKFLGNKQGPMIQVIDTIGLEANDIKDTARILDVVKAIIDIGSTSVLAMVVSGVNPPSSTIFSHY